MTNLFFIGFMGAGKSTIAKRIAGQLEARLIEMDEELVKRAGTSISAVFEEKGEAFFRDMESQLVFEIEQESNCVISCGGGVVLRKENVESMKKSGKIIYLSAAPETIYERVRDSRERPILNGNMNLEYICGLMEKRCGIYESAADEIVTTDGKNIEQICNQILESIAYRSVQT